MAYQPKSFNKFIATAAIATLVTTVVAPAAMASSFTDVAPKYREAVDFVVAMGAEGITDTKFGVHENIKRVDAAVLLVKVLDLDYENAQASGFTDVPERAVKYVNALKEAGITNGKTKTKFDPHSLITRGELAVWIQKGFELMAKNDVPFTDVADQYKEAVAALVDHNVTKGVSATKFGTYQHAKRGDYAILLMNAFDAAFEQVVSSSIKLHEVTPLEGTAAITTEDQGVKLQYTLLDQYESEMMFDAHEPNNRNDEDIEIIEGVEFTSTNPDVIDIDTLAIDQGGVATLNVGSKAGTTEIVAKIPKTNTVSKIEVTVFERENAEEMMNTTGENTPDNAGNKSEQIVISQ
ncbi:S-layer homology domain-containing protein [Bacillus sp. JJ722]|uniref:S-layer homology domain-containing protein n=1 Tax=Bacillus sp. JJ722 TaxID=3122973 RepID=UPI0030003BE4